MEKVVKDAERLMSLQMELESAKFSVIKLMEDAPNFLRSKIKDAENKRNLIASNYKNVLQENKNYDGKWKYWNILWWNFNRTDPC